MLTDKSHTRERVELYDNDENITIDLSFEIIKQSSVFLQNISVEVNYFIDIYMN